MSKLTGRLIHDQAGLLDARVAGSRVVTVGAGTASVWQLPECQFLCRFAGRITAAQLSADGNILIAGDQGGHLKRWSLDSGKLELALDVHEAPVVQLVLFADGACCTVAEGGQAVFTGPRGEIGPVHEGIVEETPPTLGANGLVALVRDDATIALHGADGELRSTLTGHQRMVTSCSFDASGTRLASGAEDGVVLLWDVLTGNVIRRFEPLASGVRQISMSPDGRLVAVTTLDRVVRIWEDSGRLLCTLPRGALEFDRAWLISNDELVTACVENSAQLWNIHGTLLQRFVGHAGLIHTVASCPEHHRILTASADGSALVWSAQVGTERVRLQHQGYSVERCLFAPDGKPVTATADGLLYVWSPEGKQLVRSREHSKPVSLATATNGYLLTAAVGEAVRLWKIGQPRPEQSFGVAGAPRAAALSAAGNSVAWANAEGIITLASTSEPHSARLGSWPKRFETITVEPGNHPRERLSKALDRFVPGASALASGVLLTRLQRWTRQHDAGIILLLDQFEELVTLDVLPDEQQWTARLLEALGNGPNAGICTIVGARRDQLDRLLSLPELARVLPHCMLFVNPMTRETWGEVLDQALQAYGYRLEDVHLKAEVLTGIGDTPMPLVQFALTRLWGVRDRRSRLIPRSALRSVGGIAGALNTHAESVREQLRQQEPQVDDVLRRLLLELTTPEGTRRSRSAEELARLAPPEQGRHLLRALMENRLLERDGDRYIFPHEALIDQWTSLSNWVKEARADRRVLTDLERDAEIWKSREDESLLWRGARLLEATQLATSGQHHISEAGTQFIDTAAGRERRARLLKRAWLAAGVAVVLLGTILYAVGQRQQRAIADARRQEAVTARDEATRAKPEAENAKTLAEEQRNRAKQAEDKAAADAQKYAADLSVLETRVNSATVAELRRIQAEVREKLGTVETKPVTAVNATPIDRQFGAPP